ncbi:S-layer homology domain-containing protein, partial [Olsenella sp. An293]|uniref:S-layer homology domain-containing protein n=1 Tax=Olsenella sp. An293 TaxID=1965626 RepID=UPI000B399E70
ACTNNGGKARRVVTAALVGVLSVGAVPAIALATGTGADVELQAVEQEHEVTIREATRGLYSSSSAEEGETFSTGYLYPTEILVDGETLKVDKGEYDVEYVPSDAVLSASDETVTTGQPTDGLVVGWWYRIGQGTTFQFNGTLTPAQADAYFSGQLIATNESGSTSYAVNPVKGAYAARVTTNQTDKADAGITADFSFKIGTPAASTEVRAYYGDTANSKIVFNGTNMLQSGKAANSVCFVDEQGNDVTPSGSVTWTKANGDVARGVTAPGTYTASFVSGGEQYSVDFTVEALDLSEATVSYDDTPNAPRDSDAFLAGLQVNGRTVNARLAGYLQVDSVTPNSWSSKGEKTVVVSANESALRAAGLDGAVVSSGSLKFAVLDDDVFVSPGIDDAKVMYGDREITNRIDVDLYEGETFDASRLSVVLDGKTYKGDQIQVIVPDGTDFGKTGRARIKVRLAPITGEMGSVLGGTKTITVNLSGATLDANQRLYFYLDGELAGNAKTVTYDGSDWLDRLEVVVKNADGEELDPSTYEVEVTKLGKKVDSIVDKGAYNVKVTGKTFTFDNAVDADFDLTVEAVKVAKAEVVADLTAGGKDYLTWTGEELTPTFTFYTKIDGKDVEVEVPAEAYEVTYNLQKVDSDGNAISTPDKTDVELKDEGAYKPVFETALDVENYDLDNVTTEYVYVTKKGVFLDVPAGEWYSQAVYDAATNGYMNGDGAGYTFSPMRELTRAEAACVLFNMAGGDALYGNLPGYNEYTGTYETGFSDVTGNEFYAKAIAWAEQTGVINGYADGTFGVSRKVTNEEFTCMLANYAKAKGEDVTVEDADATLAEYPDGSAVSDWAKDSVAWAVEAGVMGKGSAISPAGSILRMRAATMVVNYQPEKATDQVLVPVQPNRQ